MTTEIRTFDPQDPASLPLLRAWWEVGAAAGAERPYDLWLPWEEAERGWVLPQIERDVHFLGAHDADGAMVGAARASLPTADNAHLLMLDLYVAPEHRRRGVGSALLAEVERIGAAGGRTTYLADVPVRPGVPSAGEAFAARHGYDHVATEVLKVCDLAETEAGWPALEAQAAQRLGDYRLVTWGDRAPDDRVEDFCALRTAFLAEIPLEGMDLEPQQWDVEKLRRAEDRRVDAGFSQLLVGAVAPDERLVGYSNIVRGAARDRTYIDGTLVLPDHRGHRLGLAMKVRLHQLVRETYPEARIVITGNAGVNAHMNAVNVVLGYREVEHELGFQKRL